MLTAPKMMWQTLSVSSFARIVTRYLCQICIFKSTCCNTISIRCTYGTFSLHNHSLETGSAPIWLSMFGFPLIPPFLQANQFGLKFGSKYFAIKFLDGFCGKTSWLQLAFYIILEMTKTSQKHSKATITLSSIDESSLSILSSIQSWEYLQT